MARMHDGGMCRRTIGGTGSGRAGAGAESRRGASLLQQLQPAERLHHRGGDDRDRDGVLRRLQQSRSSSTRASRATASTRSRRSWPRAGRGTTRAPGSPSSCARASSGTTASRSPPRTCSAPGTRSRARTPTRSATARARALVEQPEGGDDQRRFRGDLRARPAAGLVPGAARLQPVAGLSLPRVGQGHAHQADRHGPVQVRRVRVQHGRSSSPRTPSTGSRAGPISTASSSASSATARPASSPSAPTSST